MSRICAISLSSLSVTCAGDLAFQLTEVNRLLKRLLTPHPRIHLSIYSTPHLYPNPSPFDLL
jgi:hypothetical protein